MPPPYKIAILVDRDLAGTGGVESYISNLLLYLPGPGKEVYLITRIAPSKTYHGVLLRLLPEIPETHSRLLFRRPFLRIRLLREVLSPLLSDIGPDVIFCRDLYATLAAIRRTGPPVWYSPGSLLFDEFLFDIAPGYHWLKNLNENLRWIVRFWIEMRTCRRSHRLVVASSRLGDRIRRVYRVPKSKLLRVPLATSAQVMLGDFSSRNSGEKVILSVSRLVPSKNLHLVPRILSELGRDWRWVILGGGPCLEELRKSLKEYGLSENVDLPGAVDNVFDYYRSCDVFVHLSRHENFGVVLLEALAAGRPPVVLDPREKGIHTASGEFLRHGQNAFFTRSEPKAIAEAIRQAVREGPSLRENCLDSIRNGFLFPQYVERLLNQMKETFHWT